MTTVIKIAVFMLGMYLSMRLIAAMYRVLDLWYTIRTAYPRVIRGILGWGGITIAIAVLLGDQWRHVFLWGLIVYGLFYLINFTSAKFVLGKPKRPIEID